MDHGILARMSLVATVDNTSDMPDMQEYAYDWALVDVETSGLRPGRHRVLSVAVVTISPEGEQTGEFSTLLDPGCDPGPVHIHGLTAERLRGAPTFGQVAGRIGELLQDRVMVAHNARFDYDFLAHEYHRSGLRLPVAQRLCTLALNRQVGPPTTDLKLGTLAAHYGVKQRRAHEALDDARVLAGVLRGSLAAAARLDMPLPLVACPPRQSEQFAPRVPKAPCAFRNPGPLPVDGPLTQGMKIAITGETATSRAELVSRAVSSGLNVMSSVSRYTSALVTNDPGSGTAKARQAAAEGVPIIDERAFLRLLDDVRPGLAHQGSAVRAADRTPPPAQVPVPVPVPEARAAPEAREAPDDTPQVSAATAVPPRADPEGRPLAGRRVLVLGGTHPQASAARTRIVGLGGAAAVNLSASVTDVLTLPGSDTDRRMRRIVALEVPVHAPGWLDAPTPTPVPVPGVTSVVDPTGAPGRAAGQRPAAAIVLPRGGVIDLPVTVGATHWTVAASWAQQTVCEVDVVAFRVDEDEQVSCDEDFAFYGNPESPDGAVRLGTDGPTEQAITVDLAALPPAVRKVVVAAAIDGDATFGDVGAVEITAAPGSSASSLAQATLDAATTERTLLLAELYRRGPSWRFRAVGQGYDHSLDALARGYGVDVEG